ncbi:MAG: four helix bundle protein [Bacillati bacterium ANGP1]|uniref:Four helix bundle protein n=1 Tax=Candidatus Segetimicrobium genomatis TaxID=2569760 RepID=A0A537IFA5_9BACT|nr:MAG: four helix bundle protein [Terrabacteria group bacterium ANGP1]
MDSPPQKGTGSYRNFVAQRFPSQRILLKATQFCLIARASIAETKYLLRLSLDLRLLSRDKYESLFAGYNEDGKMLQALINQLSHSKSLIPNP